MTKSEQRPVGGRALQAIEAAMRQPIEAITPDGPGRDDLATFYGMVRYHLGWADRDFAPTRVEAGKKLRPLLLVLCAVASGATVEAAAPAAAAVELLHNFTLVHDDIQDESSHRRHRETIWRQWGTPAAINVGDAIFALAHDALYDLALPPASVPAGRVLALARAFDRMALRIVEGQHLDLVHEGKWGGGEERYLAMIAGKTAAIVEFTAWAGALIAGTSAEIRDRFSAFGLALGLAFQIRDDMLGIWGTQEVTGKRAADDIRRRKESLPIVALDERAMPGVRDELHRLYAAPRDDESVVSRVLALLDAAEIADYCQARVDAYHDTARAALDDLDRRGIATAALRELLMVFEQRAY